MEQDGGGGAALKLLIWKGANKEIRRIPAPRTFDELLKVLSEWNINGHESVIRYHDRDGDEVTLGSNMEWGEALREVEAGSTFQVVVDAETSELSSANYLGGYSLCSPDSSSISFEEMETTYAGVASCKDCIKYLFGCKSSNSRVSCSVVFEILGYFGKVNEPEVNPTVFEDIRWLFDNEHLVLGVTTKNSVDFFSNKPVGSFIFRPSFRFPGKMVLTTKRAGGVAHLFIVLGSPLSGKATTLRALAVALVAKRDRQKMRVGENSYMSMEQLVD